MEHLQDRVESFAGFKPKRTKASSSKQSPILKWPHPSSFKATPDSLAEAGFYYNPDAANIDNVTCFMCKKSLWGWDEDDDPFTIHYEKCRDKCAWAVVRCQQAIGEESYDFSDSTRHPMSKAMEKARLETFTRYRWPHDAVKGHGANSKALVKAGFVCNPTEPGDDTAVCLYCNLSLAGWDEGDDPYEEHLKRDKKNKTSCAFLKAYANNSLSKSTAKRPASKVASKPPSRTTSRTLRGTASREAVETQAEDSDDELAIPSDASAHVKTSSGRASRTSSARASSAPSKTPASRRSTRGTTSKTPGSRTVSSEVDETDGGSESDAGRRNTKSKRKTGRQTRARVSAIAEEEDDIEAQQPENGVDVDVEMQEPEPQPDPEKKKRRGRPPKNAAANKAKSKKVAVREDEDKDEDPMDGETLPPPTVPQKKTHGRTRSKVNIQVETEQPVASSSKGTRSKPNAKVKVEQDDDAEPVLSGPAPKKGKQPEPPGDNIASRPPVKPKGKTLSRSKAKVEPLETDIDDVVDEPVPHGRADSSHGVPLSTSNPPAERKSSSSEDAGYATAEPPVEIDHMQVDEPLGLVSAPPSKTAADPLHKIQPPPRAALRLIAAGSDSSKRPSPVANVVRSSSGASSSRESSSRPPSKLSLAKAVNKDSLKVIEIDSDGEEGAQSDALLKSQPKGKAPLTHSESTAPINRAKKHASQVTKKKLQVEVILPQKAPVSKRVETEDVRMRDENEAPIRPHPPGLERTTTPPSQTVVPLAPGTPMSAVHCSAPPSSRGDGGDSGDVPMSDPDAETPAEVSSTPRSYHPYLAQFPIDKLSALTEEEKEMTLEQYIRREIELQYNQLKTDADRRIEEFKQKAAETRRLIETA